MKKLFSFLCLLMLGAGMSAWALSFTWTWNEFLTSSNSSYYVGYISGNSDYGHYVFEFDRNANQDPSLVWAVCFEKSKGASYKGFLWPKPGQYNITGYQGVNKTANYNPGTNNWKWGSSYYTSSIYNSQGTRCRFYSGDVYVAEGADGPYIYCTNLVLADAAWQNLYGGTHSFYVGSAAQYYSVSVNTESSTKGTTSYAMKSGYVYTSSYTDWKKNSVYTISASPKSGYRFVCWKKGSTQISTDAVTDVTITGDATYTAYFEQMATNNTITLNNQSATTAGTATVTATLNANTNLTGTPAITVPAKTGRHFGGYYTAVNGGGVQIIDANGNFIAQAGGDNTYLDASKNWKYGSDINLYAYWYYTISATASGNGSVSGAGNYYEGSSTNLTATPSNNNYYLYDWEKGTTSLGVRTNPLVQSITADAAYKAIFAAREVINITASDDMELTNGGSYWSVSGAGTDGSSNNYTMQVRFDASSLTGIFNSGVNTANTWVQKSGGSKIYAQSISVATVTEPTTGNLHIVATIIGTDEKKYVITGDYTKPIVGSWANFSWDNPNDNILSWQFIDAGNSCDALFYPLGTKFMCIQAYNSARSTSNYVWLIVKTNNYKLYANDVKGISPGTYSVATPNGWHQEVVACDNAITESNHWYWTIDNNPTNVVVGYATDDGGGRSGSRVYHGWGDNNQCVFSTYWSDYNANSQTNSNIQWSNLITVEVAEGKDGNMFVQIIRNNSPLIVIGAPAQTRKVTIANPGSGKTITVTDANSNTYATGTQHSIPEGTVLTITVSTTDNTHITGWTGTNSGEVTGSGNTYSLTVGAKNYNIAATFEGDTHTITWKSEDGTSTLETDNNVAHNAETAFNGETPTKAATAQYTYTFDGWAIEANGAKVYNNGGTPAATADATYYAHFSNTLRQYTVTWRSEDGSETLETDADQNYGTATAFNSATPTKAATAQYTYTFDGWATNAGGEKAYNNGETPAVGGDVTYYAHFSSTLRQYTVTWKNGEDVLETDENVAYGATPSYDGATPSKDATDEYTYSFNGWTPDVASVTGNATYTAVFTETANNYTLTWVTDGDALTGDYTHGTVAFGTTIVAPATPTKTGYSFTGWRSSISGTVETPSTMPAGDITYTATWEIAFSGIILWDNKDDDYYDTFKSEYWGTEGEKAKTVDVTYNRQFIQGRWSTLCLPFAVGSGLMNSLNLYGSVYEFKYATGNADSSVELYFAKASRMEAGKCYIVNAKSTLAARSSFTFGDVTIDLRNDKNDKDNPLTTASAYDNLLPAPGDLVEGTIQLVGTLRKGTLKPDEGDTYTYMGLYDNKIYYPNAAGNTIPAYRGVFRIVNTPAESISRVRIVVEGETTTELEVINGEMVEAAEARKFVRDGILYIERDGVLYNAQGQKVK